MIDTPLSWKKRLSALAETLRDVVFPPVCASCRKVGSLLCAGCYDKIPWITGPVCARCGQKTNPTAVACPTCLDRPLPLQQIRAATHFTDPIPAIIHKMKYEGMFALATPLAQLMVDAWPRWQTAVDLVVPIPLHATRHKKRGYNQAALLAKQFCNQLGFTYHPDVLQRTKLTQPQVGLHATERLSNMAHAFKATEPTVANRHILLIDDVCTTGATLAAATDALQAAGAASVSGYCIARA